MFKALFGRNTNYELAHALYGAVVARARDVQFYSRYGVPDSFDGRFEMLVMHLFLLHERLKDEDKASRQVSQLVFDAFLDDMDAALREAAVGDQTVPKRIAKMTQVFYGRAGAYEEALKAQDIKNALESVISRNLFPDGDSNGREKALACYMAWQYQHISNLEPGEIVQSAMVFQGALPEETEHVAAS
jgi:cytochrome b pre-mRNA-processing protein 3